MKASSRPIQFIGTTGHADPFPETTDRRFFVVTVDPQDRRPGVGQLAEQLRKQNPDWSPTQCLVKAKVLWHQRNKG